MPTPRELVSAAITTLITPLVDVPHHRQANEEILNYIDTLVLPAVTAAQDALDAANAAQAAANAAALQAAAAVAAVEEATDIIELPLFSDFPAVGEPDKLYRTTNDPTHNDKIYRWDGAAYSVVGGTGLSGVTVMTDVGATPNAQGGSISGPNLTLQPANINFPGVVTIVAQVLKGVKEFADSPKIPLTVLGAAEVFVGQLADKTIGRITSAKATSLLDTFARTTQGVVPAPNGSIGASARTLYEDGNWRDPFEVAATKAAVAGTTNKRLVLVNADETNNGDASLYMHDGAALRFLLTLPAV